MTTNRSETPASSQGARRDRPVACWTPSSLMDRTYPQVQSSRPSWQHRSGLSKCAPFLHAAPMIRCWPKQQRNAEHSNLAQRRIHKTRSPRSQSRSEYQRASRLFNVVLFVPPGSVVVRICMLPVPPSLAIVNQIERNPCYLSVAGHTLNRTPDHFSRR